MKTLKTLFKSSLVTLVIVSSIAMYATFSTQAGTLTAAYLYLSRIQANLNGSTSGQEVELVLAIDTAQSIPSGGTVSIEFPDAEDATWCRTAGSLTVTAVSSSPADLGSTNWEIDSALPTSGTLSASCTQGSGASSADTITISSVGALTAGTTYGVQVSSNVGIIGTNSTNGEHEVTISAENGVTIDSKTFKISLVTDDTVEITATVSDVPSVSCSISSTSVALGTLYPGGAYATGSHTISTSTTSTGGYYWAAYGEGDGGATATNDAGLWRDGGSATTDLLQSGPGATLDLTVVGAQGFGMTVSDPDVAGAAVVPGDFNAGTLSAGTFGTLDRTSANAKLILYQNATQGSAEAATITYGARAGSSATAGTYREFVTFVCGGYY